MSESMGYRSTKPVRSSSIRSRSPAQILTTPSESPATSRSECQALGGYSRCRTRIVRVPFASSVHGVSPVRKGRSMKKVEDEMRGEYKRSDFRKLERGKFFKEVAKGTSVVLLDPKLAKAFPTSEAVNEALRGLLALTEQTARITGRSSRTARKRAAA